MTPNVYLCSLVVRIECKCSNRLTGSRSLTRSLVCVRLTERASGRAPSDTGRYAQAQSARTESATIARLRARASVSGPRELASDRTEAAAATAQKQQQLSVSLILVLRRRRSSLAAEILSAGEQRSRALSLSLFLWLARCLRPSQRRAYHSKVHASERIVYVNSAQSH